MAFDASRARYVALSQKDFAALGLDRLAYVKRILRDGELVFEIHTADGDAVAALDSQDVAVATILQNGLMPVSVH
ncbi:MAG: DUF1150 family protein [Rhodospirillales bacterium]|jgi:hypothetical protein